MKILKTILLLFGIALLAGVSYLVVTKNNDDKFKNNERDSEESTKNLLSQTNGEAGIAFTVKPLDFNFQNPVKFEIKIDTHSGSLDFDLVKISFLEDDKGSQYKPFDWQGPGPEGHHLEGILIFPKLQERPKKLKLVIQTVPPRIFEWNLE